MIEKIAKGLLIIPLHFVWFIKGINAAASYFNSYAISLSNIGHYPSKTLASFQQPLT